MIPDHPAPTTPARLVTVATVSPPTTARKMTTMNPIGFDAPLLRGSSSLRITAMFATIISAVTVADIAVVSANILKNRPVAK